MDLLTVFIEEFPILLILFQCLLQLKSPFLGAGSEQWWEWIQLGEGALQPLWIPCPTSPEQQAQSGSRPWQGGSGGLRSGFFLPLGLPGPGQGMARPRGCQSSTSAGAALPGLPGWDLGLCAVIPVDPLQLRVFHDSVSPGTVLCSHPSHPHAGCSIPGSLRHRGTERDPGSARAHPSGRTLGSSGSSGGALTPVPSRAV